MFDFDSDEEDSIESSIAGSRITTVNGSITGNSSPKDDKSLNSSQSGLVKDDTAENTKEQHNNELIITVDNLDNGNSIQSLKTGGHLSRHHKVRRNLTYIFLILPTYCRR